MSTRKSIAGFGAVIAWVRDASRPRDEGDVLGPDGHILFAVGCFEAELEEHGPELGDHEISVEKKAPRAGLLIFEGFVEHGHGPDSDVYWSGKWRELEHWELLQVNAGLNPIAMPECSCVDLYCNGELAGRAPDPGCVFHGNGGRS